MKDIAAFFEKLVATSGAAGAQLSVIKGDERIDLAVGLRDTGLGEPMAVDTANQIGSVTKVFNAALVLELVARGELDLDEPVIKRIPEFRLEDQEAAEKITLRHLLSMSAGIDNGDYRFCNTLQERIESLATCPQHFAPGEGYGYSNAATDISGYVAQRAMGRSWDDLLRELVLDPAKLIHSATRDAERDLDRMSRGHIFDPVGKSHSYVEMEHVTLGSSPAGSTLTSNAADLATLGKALLDGYLDPSSSVFAPSTIEGMFTPQIDVPIKSLATAWCLGLSKVEWNGVPIWWHAGGNAKGSSWLFILPEQRGVFACTCNTTSVVLDFMPSMVNSVFEAAFGVAPVVPERITVPAGDLDRYCGVYAASNGELDVERHGDRLLMTHRMQWGPAKLVEERGYLEPIGPGRFWFRKSDDDRLTNLPNEFGFSGADAQGRATHAVNLFVPYGRTHGERIVAERAAQAAEKASPQ